MCADTFFSSLADRYDGAPPLLWGVLGALGAPSSPVQACVLDGVKAELASVSRAVERELEELEDLYLALRSQVRCGAVRALTGGFEPLLLFHFSASFCLGAP